MVIESPTGLPTIAIVDTIRLTIGNYQRANSKIYIDTMIGLCLWDAKSTMVMQSAKC